MFSSIQKFQIQRFSLFYVGRIVSVVPQGTEMDIYSYETLQRVFLNAVSGFVFLYSPDITVDYAVVFQSLFKNITSQKTTHARREQGHRYRLYQSHKWHWLFRDVRKREKLNSQIDAKAATHYIKQVAFTASNHLWIMINILKNKNPSYISSQWPTASLHLLCI